MLKFENGVIVELTPEEEEAVRAAVDAHNERELRRPLERDEVIDLVIKSMVNMVDIPDSTSLRMKTYYPTFDEIVAKKSVEDKTLPVGFKLTHDGKLWKVRQKHMVQAHFAPSIDTASLYERINEENTGTKDDPIPFEQGMTVYKDLYYSYEQYVFLCIRSSGDPLYTNPDLLLGNYFEFSHNLDPEVEAKWQALGQTIANEQKQNQ